MTARGDLDTIARALEVSLTDRVCIGEIIVIKTSEGHFLLSHRDDERLDELRTFRSAEDAIALAKYDDAGNYRPLKTAPNLRHGWRLELDTLAELKPALDYFYPGRLAVFAAWEKQQVQTTSLRETLARQSGMYRVAARISDSQTNEVVADFCRSDGGCLRTILWKRDDTGAIASTKLPEQKFDPACDQSSAGRRSGTAARITAATVPLLCQEACNLLIAECRKVVKGE